jgi:hypothetical protein
LCTFWNRSLLLCALLAAPALSSATPLESGLARGAFADARSFRAVAAAGAALARRAPHAHQPQGGAMLAASVGLLGLIAVRRLRALRAV